MPMNVCKYSAEEGIRSLARWGRVCSCVALACAASATTVLRYGGTGFENQWPGMSGNPAMVWQAIPSLNDPRDASVSNEHFDIVGDASAPAVFWASGASYLYFRVRVDNDIAADATQWAGSLYLMIKKEGLSGGTTPDFAFGWDDKERPLNHGLEMLVYNPSSGNRWSDVRFADRDGNAAQKIAPPDFALTGGDGYIRTLDQQPTTAFGQTTFVDYAVSWGFLADLGLAEGQT